MGLGTILRVGFDALQVRAGLAGLSRMFGGAMRGVRQVGIGAARQIGAKMTDIWGRMLTALPEGWKEAADWAGDLTDMSAQTGVAISKLVVMEEALRLAGASAADSSRMLSTLGKNIGDAMKEAGPAREALNKMGFMAEQFRGVGLDEAFEIIGKKAGSMSWEVGELEGTMTDLFGGRMGYKLIRFFRDFDGGMEKAEKNVGHFGRRMDGEAARLDDLSDAWGRWTMVKRQIALDSVDVLAKLFGGHDSLPDAIMNIGQSLDKKKMWNTVMSFLNPGHVGDNLRAPLENFGRQIGGWIGSGMAESMKGTRFGRFMFSSGGGGAEEKQPPLEIERLWSQGETQTGLLRQIATKYTGWQ